MKKYIIVGLGNFGATLAEELFRKGNDVVAIDKDEVIINRIAPNVSQAIVADGSDRGLLERFGASECDAAVVSTGEDVTASVLTLMALMDLGVRRVYVKVNSVEHSRVMARLGATETIFPEKESAQNLITRLEDEGIVSYVHLGGGFSLQEMVVPPSWQGSNLRTLKLPIRYKISVIGIHDVLSDELVVPPDPDRPLNVSDALIVAGSPEALGRAAKVQ